MGSFETLIGGGDGESTAFGNRMANIFAESDTDETIYEDKPNEPTKVSSKMFTATAFISVEDAQNIKCGLLVVNNDDKIFTIVYDASKKCIFQCELNRLSIKKIEQKSLTIIYDFPIETDRHKAKITFIDVSDFTRYAVLLFLHNTSNSFHILETGTGEPIEENCSVLYDTVKYNMEDSGLSLPITQANVKARLTSEKLSSHQFLSHFLGLSKNSTLLVKSDKTTVLQINIRKIKATSKTPELYEEPEETSSSDKIIEQDVMHPSTSEPKDPEVSVNLTNSTNLYEVVHRVVGVEIDRMEMRLNAKLDNFEKKLMERLEKQTSLLEMLIKKTENL